MKVGARNQTTDLSNTHAHACASVSDCYCAVTLKSAEEGGNKSYRGAAAVFYVLKGFMVFNYTQLTRANLNCLNFRGPGNAEGLKLKKVSTVQPKHINK